MITVMLENDSRKNKQLVARPNVILFSKALFCVLSAWKSYLTITQILVCEFKNKQQHYLKLFTIIKITISF